MFRLREEWRAVRLALGLLTRLPVSPRDLPDGKARGRSLHYYPLAGLVIGALLGLLSLSLPEGVPLLAAVVLVAAWVALTGGLHLDGLADCADAWVGGMGNRERTLAILKEPTCGPFGVTALVLLVAVKVAALHTLLGAGFPGWWLAPLLVRAALPLAFLALPYVRAGGMGDDLAGGASRPALALALGLTLVLLALILPAPHWWLWLAVSALVFALWRAAMKRRLGGFTGDGAGALVELLEGALLLASALVAGGGV